MDSSRIYRDAPDTIVVTDDMGRSINLMRTVMDDNGEMVASDNIQASYISARFRNVAERNGMIEICFDVNVPKEMLRPSWQLRIYPRMRLLQDTVYLDKLYLTGDAYRKRQLRGYEQYERFIKSIITDTSIFIRRHQLEMFLSRNIPQLAAFKYDSTYVCDEAFCSAFGVSVPEAVGHYTNKMWAMINKHRASLDERMKTKYIKSPIEREGLRLDTIITSAEGNFVYRYVQSISTRAALRKIDVDLRSDIWQQDELQYASPYGDSLSFYVSSLSSFAEIRDRYITKIVERSVRSDAFYHIDFLQARSEFDPNVYDNALYIKDIKDQLRLLYTDEKLELDSITIAASASPEGSKEYNKRLSAQRSKYTCDYFKSFLDAYRDSLITADGFYGDISSDTLNMRSESYPKISFVSSDAGENWALLDRLVSRDTLITDADKLSYNDVRAIEDEDEREAELMKLDFYPSLAERLYPKLRTVQFAFNMHRRGQVKDTLRQTVVDSVYTQGIKALILRDYKKALLLLAPYEDYNTAVSYLALDRNLSAIKILQSCPKSPKVNYLLSIAYSRMGDVEAALNAFVSACRADPSYIHRANLDPEISALKNEYDIKLESDEEFN